MSQSPVTPTPAQSRNGRASNKGNANRNPNESIKRIAEAAAESSKRHLTQFANLAALARTIQTYIPANSVEARDYAQLSQAFVECAERYQQLADIDDIAFSIIAADSPQLLDKVHRASVLRAARRVRAAH
ncbi:hypothetical protein P3T18_002371 [Paraburkholderia sp. GAS199]|uniref:hypothetical protein n=1 Tax=Paraburkholderia sp. GAS199 TaxID=3035126 RepID=UPI003D1F47B3